ncbi:MAG TPA: class I SAM-dependent methyltransferase [Vicinamibacterales bacterium]|jgi:SAM-dependent methyltransferase|nr:class I SAM-dependent methyltransferase [Vicinamibacterales bacterium]
MTELYDTIGRGYRRHRQPDPRIARAIADALDGIDAVVNVGAGAGSYEPRDRLVIAVEPSMTMIRQRAPMSAGVVQATADALPFPDATFGAALAILTLHHWSDWRRGLREMARVARDRTILLTWDPSAAGFWLVEDYFPDILSLDRQIFPSLDAIARELGPLAVSSIPIPGDCIDGFLGAYWKRPHAYLDASVRGAISSFSRVPNVEDGVERLERDLQSGAWHRTHGAMLANETLDLGYRLVVARSHTRSGQ